MESYFFVNGLTTSVTAVKLGDLIVSSKTSIDLNDPLVRVRGLLPPLKDIFHVVKTGLSGRKTDIQAGEYGMLPKLLELCMSNNSTFELESLTTQSFTPSKDFLAESLESRFFNRINAEYKDPMFMVTAVHTARRTMPTDPVKDELLEFVVAYQLRKIDASHLREDPDGEYDDPDDARELVLFDDDATSEHFDTVETFTIGAADCLWNIPLVYVPQFFRREANSIFNECQIWLAQLFLDDSAARHAFKIASWKTRSIGPYGLQSNLCRLLHMFSLDLSIQHLRENGTDLVAQMVGREVESIAWIITMEISKDLVASSDDFSWLNEESKSIQEDALRAIDSESRQIHNIRGNPRVKLQGGRPNLSLEMIQLAKDFLLEGSAFRQFCDNLRIWVFPIMSEYIESVIRTSLNPEGGIYIVECRARWELLQYWRQELSGTNALSEILTITGSPICAQATSASDYIEGIWGSQARTLLSAIESNLALGTCCISFSRRHQIEIMFRGENASALESEDNIEDANIRVTGGLCDVVRSLTQLSWIAASFRLLEKTSPLDEQDYGTGNSRANYDEHDPAKATAYSNQTEPGLRDIMMSYVRFEECEREEPNLRPFFKLSLFSSTQEGTNRRWSLVPTSFEEQLKFYSAGESCWIPLFKRGVLARGFPVLNRLNGCGLELPLSLMTFVAKAESVVENQGQIFALVGPQWILRPISTTTRFTEEQRQHRPQTQWHLEKVGTDWEKSREFDLDSHHNNNTVSISSCNRDTMSESRMFLGYFDRGQVLSGTEELLRSNRISNSNCTAVKSRLRFVREGTVSAGVSIKGIFSITGNTKWIMPKGLSATFLGTRDFDDRLDGSCNRPILVYDIDARSAWILSELSVVLHMALVYLEQPTVRRRRRPEEGPWPRLPYAQALSQGGLAACETIRDHADISLYTRTEDQQAVKFWNIIDRLMKELATLRAAESVQDASFGFHLSKSRLKGWDFHDLVTNEEHIFKKELPRAFNHLRWWDLVDSKRFNVIFGKNFGQLIRPVFPNGEAVASWLKVPTGADLLTVSMPAFRKLVENHNDNGLCDNLGPDLLWHRPFVAKLGRCKYQLCDGECTYIQEVHHSPKYSFRAGVTPPSDLINKDAVTFGDVKQYHKSLQTPSATMKAAKPDGRPGLKERSSSELNAASEPGNQEARCPARLTDEPMAPPSLRHPRSQPSSGRRWEEVPSPERSYEYRILPIQQATLYQHKNDHIVIPTANASINTATAPEDRIDRAKGARDTIGKMVSKLFRCGTRRRRGTE